MTEAFITPELLNWARLRSNLPLDIVAQKISSKTGQIVSWEKGESFPTFRQAQNLAKVLHIPFGYLFLSSPPDEKPAIPDLRTHNDVELQHLSVDFLDLLNDVLRKQEWYRYHLKEDGFKPLKFIGCCKLKDTVGKVAEDMRNTLGIDDSLRKQASSWEDFLRKFIQNVESNNILVMRSGIVGNNTHRKLSAKEFRGFVICDNIAPLIFLNGKDAKSAQIFTLAHELAHLWLGESGISNPDLGEPDLRHSKTVETFCNQVAAELLIPQDGFLSNWKSEIPIATNVYKLVRQYRVSSIVVLRRAYDLNVISRELFYEHYRSELRNHIKKEADSQEEESGGNFYATLWTRNSSVLTSAIVSAAYEGRLLFRDAARFLGVKVKTLESIANKLRAIE